MTKLHILIADDERPARFGLAKALASPDHVIHEAADGRQAVDCIRGNAIDLVFLDLNMPVLDGQGVLRELAGETGLPEIIVVSASDRIDVAVEALRTGAADYLTKPYEVERVRSIAARTLEKMRLQGQVTQLQQQLDQQTGCGAMLGVSRPMRELFALVTRAAQAPVDLLIRGETGTGKELVAREIHRLSPRASGPFVAVNTAAIAESLAESELFGHVRGAFTGADRDREGVFEQAHGGTLFLDEIGDMPGPAQTKILRALQQRTIQPVGSSRTVQVDVRVISATHQDLEAGIAEGRFRQDLYYRIKGLELRLPPLRQRREDILLLANYFLERYQVRISAENPVVRNAGHQEAAEATSGRAALHFSQDAVNALLAYSWPGNVRELEQSVTAAASLAIEPVLHARDLRLPVRTDLPQAFADFDALLKLPLSEAKSQLVESFERLAVQAALEAHAGNVSAAARQLGIHRQSLQQKMAQLGIVRPV